MSATGTGKVLLAVVGLVTVLGALGSCEQEKGYVKLTQADFAQGTYQIKVGGRYCLVEDVSFNPNSLEWIRANRNPMATAYESSDVLPEQYTFAGGEYDPSAYGIGFFAAIAISASGVVVDLNGHTLEQSKEHALQQRFFSLIELADRPFRSGQGPHSFGRLVPGKRVTVRNGRLGRSSHHAIHGNDNEDVLLADMVLDGWEVAAVALNNVTGCTVLNVEARSRMGVPVLGTYSAARFVRPYLNCVAEEGDVTLDVAGISAMSARVVRDELRVSMVRVFLDVVQGAGTIDPSRHPHEYALFHNMYGVVDGNAYGFLINGVGVAVNGFPVAPAANVSMDVVFDKVRVTQLQAAIHEVPGLRTADGAGVQTDPVGAVFQVFNRHPKTWVPVTMTTDDAEWARYKGNVLANAQAVVAKAVLSGFFTPNASVHSCRKTLDVSRLSMTHETLDWVEGRTPTLRGVLGRLPKTGVMCNMDSMFHVNKGVVAFKMDAGHRVTMRDVEASNLVNFGAKGSLLCGYSAADKSHPSATLSGYNGADVRGFSFSGSEVVKVSRASVFNAESAWGSVIGYDVHGASANVECWMCNALHLRAGSRAASPNDYTGPNRIPVADCHRVLHNTKNVSYMWSNCADVSSPTS